MNGTCNPEPATSNPVDAVCYHGGNVRERDDQRFGRAAAVVPQRLSREQLDGIYRQLAPHARCHPVLAKKWKVWDVLATDDWVQMNQQRKTAP